MKRTTLVASSAAAVLLALSTLSTAQAQYEDSADREMLALAGEFEIGNGESQTIAHHKKDKEYRICAAKARHGVPLKVTYDGKESTIAVGNCADFEAMNIKVSAAGKLDKDMVLIGRYHRLTN